MAIAINGSGTVTGISVGGLPDGIVDAGTLATNSVDSDELINGSIDAGHLASGVGGVSGITDNSNANAITISSDEEVTMPSQPSFSGRGTGYISNVTGDGTVYTVVFSQIFDQNADFDGTTFTAPVTGKYLLTFFTVVSGHDGSSDTLALNIVTSNRSYARSDTRTNDLGAEVGGCLAIVADMDASDTATCTAQVSGGAQVADLSGQSTFTGCLLA